MHELSICSSIVGSVLAHDAGREVATVHVRVGAMRQIVPETLIYCWSLVTEQTDLAAAALKVERVPAKIRCPNCGQERVLAELAMVCPLCPGQAVDLVEGDEFLITSLDLAGA